MLVIVATAPTTEAMSRREKNEARKRERGNFSSISLTYTVGQLNTHTHTPFTLITGKRRNITYAHTYTNMSAQTTIQWKIDAVVRHERLVAMQFQSELNKGPPMPYFRSTI